MGYEVNETATVDIQASQGALQSSERDKVRVLDVEVRVGDYDLDNTHQIRGNGGGGGGSTRPASVLMPIDDDVDALKSVIWLATDRQYQDRRFPADLREGQPVRECRRRRHLGGPVPRDRTESRTASQKFRCEHRGLGKEDKGILGAVHQVSRTSLKAMPASLPTRTISMSSTAKAPPFALEPSSIA